MTSNKGPIPLTLAPALRSSEETVSLLRDLLDQAQAGNLTGIALVAARKERVWDFHVSGVCNEQTLPTIGMLHTLAVHLESGLLEGAESPAC